jgi:putative membrane protein
MPKSGDFAPQAIFFAYLAAMTTRFFESTFFVMLSFKSYLFRKLFRSIVIISALTAIFCALYEFEVLRFNDSVTLPSLMGAALGILLVFRNNTAYERWWEARKVLGALVNVSRAFAMQGNELLQRPEARKDLLALIAAFCYALKEHLREGVLLSELHFLPAGRLERIARSAHRPVEIATQIMALLREEREAGRLSEYATLQLMAEAEKLVDILGKCERIRNTPMPASHSYLLKSYVFIYTLTMPVSFVGTLHWWSIVAVASIYFVTMSLVAIAEEIEEPFGRDPNDLPVDTLAKNIHRNLNQIYATRLSDAEAAQASPIGTPEQPPAREEGNRWSRPQLPISKHFD